MDELTKVTIKRVIDAWDLADKEPCDEMKWAAFDFEEGVEPLRQLLILYGNPNVMALVDELRLQYAFGGAVLLKTRSSPTLKVPTDGPIDISCWN